MQAIGLSLPNIRTGRKKANMKALLLIVTGCAGLYYTLRILHRNVTEIRSKEKGSHSASDLYFNYPLMFLWFGYLIVFFIGLMVNNLILG